MSLNSTRSGSKYQRTKDKFVIDDQLKLYEDHLYSDPDEFFNKHEHRSLDDIYTGWLLELLAKLKIPGSYPLMDRLFW